MDGSLIDLARYRIERAEENLADAAALLGMGSYASSANRAYYAAFHALRAVNALDGFDSSKHSGVIAHFNQMYIKTGKLDKRISKLISGLMRVRERADYDDFIVITPEDAEDQYQKAEEIMNYIRPYLAQTFSSMESFI